jgi:hypothetical protein
VLFGLKDQIGQETLARTGVISPLKPALSKVAIKD